MDFEKNINEKKLEDIKEEVIENVEEVSEEYNNEEEMVKLEEADIKKTGGLLEKARELIKKMRPEKGVETSIEELPDVVKKEIDKLKEYYYMANDQGRIRIDGLQKLEDEDGDVNKYQIRAHIDKHGDYGRGYVGKDVVVYEARVKDEKLLGFKRKSSKFHSK